MVSMVDWSRFTRGSDLSANSSQPGSRYHKQRETEAIRQAEEQGYFLLASKSFIEDVFAPEDATQGTRSAKFAAGKTPKDLAQVQLIHLTSAHLRTVGDIGLCRNLKVCILSNNYIRRIDGLVTCEKLVKLDLGHNQISSLPGSDFWSAFDELQILHLHDNPLGRTESLAYLSSAPQLTVLTLYDTPLCLKRNYRHHVVNSIWSLKALDNHVISDEEIIEDAELGGYFSSKHPAFNVNLTVEPPTGTTYEEHLAFIHGVKSAVNRILSHHSPVLILQRYIRGYLVRKRKASESGICASKEATGEKKKQGWKGCPDPHPSTLRAVPPPSSPMFDAANNTDSIEIDYDTYIQNRRPGSTGQSEGSHASRDVLRAESPASSANAKQKKNLFINLTKLQTGTFQILQDDAIAIETLLPTEASLGRAERSERRCKKKKENEAKAKRIKSVKQFFGPIVKTSNSPEPSEDEEIPIVQYRLKGLKKSIQYVDATTELIIARREAGNDVRLAEFDHHMKVDNEPKPVIKRSKEPSSLRKMLSRTQSTMGMSCLRAVQQAYRDREKMEQHALKMEYVMSMKEQRENSRDRVKLFGDEKRNLALRERTHEQKKMMEDVDRKDMQRMSYLERSGEKRVKSSQHWKLRRGEMTFTTDFNVQNTSVSNALMRHDRQAVQEDKLQEKAEIVQAHKTVEKEQQEIVKKYLEHRQLMRQAEVAMSRAALDTKMLQEANDRLIEARTRVAHQKAKTANVQATLTFPTISTPNLPPTTRVAKKGLDPRPIFTSMYRSTTVA